MKIPGFKERAICTHCGQLDSIDYIILRCQVPGQRLIWSLTEEILQKKKADWTRGHSIPKIISTIITPVETNGERTDPRTSRLQRIVITESIALIW